jgi:hypothetical protein
MALTYTLISSNVLSASAVSVTFSSIPATYTDLVVKISARKDTSNPTVFVRFNGVTTSSYKYQDLQATGSVLSGATSTAAQFSLTGGNNMSTDVSETFSNAELYIPNYIETQRKSFLSSTAREGITLLSADNNLGVISGEFSETAAISSILLTTLSANFVSGSSFYLYGIKNS